MCTLYIILIPAGAGGGGGGGGVAGVPPLREFSLLKLSRRGFCATIGEGRGTFPPLVSLRPIIPGAAVLGGGAGLRGEGGAERGNVQCIEHYV